MYEWEVQYSETKTDNERISCASWTATVYAETEDEARKIIAEEEPGKTIDKITRGECIDDDV